MKTNLSDIMKLPKIKYSVNINDALKNIKKAIDLKKFSTFHKTSFRIISTIK